MGSLQEIISFIQQSIADELSAPINRIKVIRRNRNLKEGDFQIPSACLVRGKSQQGHETEDGNESPALPDQPKQTDDLGNVLLRIPWTTTRVADKQWIIFQRSYRGKDGNLYLSLDRCALFLHILRNFGSYISDRPKNGRKILLNIADAHTEVDSPMTVDNVRAELTTQHLANLLETNGYTCQFVPIRSPDSWKNCFSLFNLSRDIGASHKESSCNNSELFGLLGNSKYRIVDTDQELPDPNPKREEKRSIDGAITLDLRKFMADKNLQFGRNAFDKNIDNITLPHGNVMQQLKELVISSGKMNETVDKCVHIVCRPQSFRQQQVQLLWQMIPNAKPVPKQGAKIYYLLGLCTCWSFLSLCMLCYWFLWECFVFPPLGVPHAYDVFNVKDLVKLFRLSTVFWGMPVTGILSVHLVNGGVSLKVSPKVSDHISIDDYFKLRKTQMEHAFILKYGDVVKGTGWDDTINQLTTAVMRIELLHNNCSSQVKIDMTALSREEDDAPSMNEAGVGVFIMYNYARLATLLQNFEKAVQEGVYPPLPPLEAIDFKCLREEEEWLLLFNYLLPYSGIVEDTVRDIELDTLRPNLQTHKVCQFLHDLSRDLSSYYSRVHILVESRAQLLPVMYARIHLLQALHDCTKHSLLLLGIKPMSQL